MRHSVWLLQGIGGALLLFAAAAAPGSADAQSAAADAETVRIELRVWQHLEDEHDIRVSVRPADGSWRTLGVIPLPLDDGHSTSGRYRYGDITVQLPLRNEATPLSLDMRVWQHVEDGSRIYISARARGDSWRTLGTVQLPLDDGISSAFGLRYGDISYEAPLIEDEVSTLAGQPGVRGYRDGPADQALFGRFAEDVGGLGVALDRDESVIVADRQNRAIRRILPDGTVTTIAGGNGQGVRDGPAETAQFAGPTDVAIADDGTIYVADYYGHRIRQITAGGMVTTVAGGGPFYGHPYPDGAWGDFRDGSADEARFEFPHSIAIDPYGDLFVAEDYGRIRRVSPSGTVVTFAGGMTLGHRDGPPGFARFFRLLAMDVDADGNLYVLETGGSGTSEGVAVRRVTTLGAVSTLFRSAAPHTGGTLATPQGLAVSSDGTIYIANTGRHQIVELTPQGVLRAVAGAGEEGYADGPREVAMFNLPAAIAVARDGSLVVADVGNNVIRTIDLSAGALPARALAVAGAGEIPRLQGVEVTLFAGRPGGKYADIPRFRDGAGRDALFYRPRGMALDADGNVIVADSGNDAIRRITPAGEVTTISGRAGEGLRDGPRAQAQFSEPQGVAVGRDGSIYVADAANNRVRRIAPDGSVTTVAGGGPPAAAGNWGAFRDGPGSEARFREPSSLAFDGAGNLLITDRGNNRIRLLSPAGEVSTVAGASAIPAPDRHPGNSGSFDGPGNQALFFSPDGIVVDAEGVVFFTESNHAVRMIDGGGYVSAVLRTPHTRYGGPISPFIDGIAIGSDGALYVADPHYRRVVRITREGELSIVADSMFSSPAGIIATPAGDLLVSDTGLNVIWKISFRGAQ